MLSISMRCFAVVVVVDFAQELETCFHCVRPLYALAAAIIVVTTAVVAFVVSAALYVCCALCCVYFVN